MGEFALRTFFAKSKEDNRKDELLFAEEFFDLPTEEPEEEETSYPTLNDTIFYLDEDNNTVYEMFRVLSLFLQEGYSLDPTLMVELIKEKNLPLQDTLLDLASIHIEYYNIVKHSNRTQEG